MAHRHHQLLLSLLATATVVAIAASVLADPDWQSLPYTTHADYQAVDANGFATFPLGSPVRVRGVIIADPANLLDPTPGAPYLLGGQWQLHIQTTDPNDFGGIACWIGQFYGNLPFVDPNEVYDEAAWLAELDRVSHDPNTGHPFAVGDLVEVRARVPGLNFAGKTNINEAHNTLAGANFDVLLIEASHGVPTPTVITLADVKDESDAFIFDATRQTGAERHQCELVRINDVKFVDVDAWGPDVELHVTDGTGRTLPVLLGRGDGFEVFPPPTGTVDLIGIFDQEDLVSADGYKDGYRLWITHYTGSGCVLPEPWPLAGDTDCDGTVGFGDINPFVDAVLYGAAFFAAEYPCCLWLNADIDGNGDVGFEDINPFVDILLD